MVEWGPWTTLHIMQQTPLSIGMKTTDGQCRYEEFAPGRMVYVPPYRGHRSMNTGDEPLISFCVYPGDAGHNDGDIEREGLPKRAFRRRGKIVVE